MKIVHIASEVYPFSKTGGLADVAYSLPVYQKKLKNDIYVITPLYKGILEKFDKIKYTGKKTWVDTELGVFEFGIFKTKMNGVTFIFLSNIFLFERGGYYGEDGKDYPDNFLIFGGFSKAALNVVKYIIDGADIIHCHDWQTALTPALLKTEYQDVEANIVLTIHNLAFQGLFKIEDVLKLKIDPWLCGFEGLEFYGLANFLKAGILMSDFVTTVSPTYSQEVMTPEYGFGLEGVLKKCSFKFAGILNGLDYKIWNPNTDPFIVKKYNKRSYKDKIYNKIELCKRCEMVEDLPLFVFVSRFTEQKGISILIDALKVFTDEANFILLGDGDSIVKQKLALLDKRKNVKIFFGYKEALGRQMYAGGDFYLMPSKFEPCGISQLIAMRYGSVPIVRKTGGLKDTVKDLYFEGGHGIVFENYSSEKLIEAIWRAIDAYNSALFDKLILNNMKKDYSWVNTAKEYVRMYENVLYK
ncbi:MAG: glycogen synthase [Deferribacterales bacterium]|nr:glycogen synthase [Deferribacterales bacterium]